MFGDLNTSIFSTAPTRAAAVTPSNPIGPVGGSQCTTNTPPSGNSLFSGASPFNVTAPFQATGTPSTDAAASDPSRLSISGNGFTRAAGFQVNQSAGERSRPSDVAFLFNGANNSNVSVLAGSNVTSTPPATATALLQDALLKGYTGSLNPMTGSPYFPVAMAAQGRAEPVLPDRRASQSMHAAFADMNMTQEASRENGPRLHAAKDGSTQSLPMVDDGRFPQGMFKHELNGDQRGQQVLTPGAGSLGGLSPAHIRKPRTGGLSRELVKRQTTKAEAQELLTRTVHMRCLPPALSQAQLAKFLSECGTFDRVRVCTNGRANQKWVYGFVEFANTQGAEALLSRTGFQMGADTDGKPLWIKCIRAAQPIQDLLPSDADSARGRGCRFGSDERANQSIASLAATPAGALWEQAKATMTPGTLAMADRHLSDDAVSSAEDGWETSDQSLHTPHLFKEDTNALLAANGPANPQNAQSHSHTVGAAWSSTASGSARANMFGSGSVADLVATVSPKGRDATGPNAATDDSTANTAVLNAVWAAQERLSATGAQPHCVDMAAAVAQLQSDFCAALATTAPYAALAERNDDGDESTTRAILAKGASHCLETLTSLQTFMTTHELLLSALPFDSQDGNTRGGRRGLPLFACRFAAHFCSAVVALRALDAHRATLRTAVHALLACFTSYFPTPSSALTRPAPNAGRRGKAPTTAAAEVFQWVLNLLGVLITLLKVEAVSVERECVATVLAVYVSSSRAETRLFRELGSDLYSLKVEQLANMLSHVLTKDSTLTPPSVLTALAEAATRDAAMGTTMGSQLVRNLPFSLQVL